MVRPIIRKVLPDLAVVVATQVRILTVVGGDIIRCLDAKTPATVRTDCQALQQVNLSCFLVSLGSFASADAERQTALPQFLCDDRLVLDLRDLGRCGAIADTLGAY